MNLPIFYLSECVSRNFSNLHSLDISGEIQRGLKPQIRYSASLIPVAGISEDGDVEISCPFCQMLWIICFIALRTHDSASISSSYEKMNATERKEFLTELNVDTPETRYLKQLLNWGENLHICSELGDIIKSILSSNFSEDDINSNEYVSDVSSPFAQKVNSLYCYGVTFILLHEYSHHALGHNLKTDGNTQEENDADANAFWTLSCDLNGAEKTTAMMGVICALSALLFVNPDLTKDGVHPQENERLFAFYDIIFDESHKKSYRQMLIMLLTVWAICCEISDFPIVKELGATEECLSLMKEYLAVRASHANIESRVFRN